MSTYYPVAQPISQSVDQPYARWTYETDLSEAIPMSAIWEMQGRQWIFRFSGKVINGADTDRLLYNSADISGNSRVLITHGIDRVIVQPSDGATSIEFDFPTGTIPANGLINLQVHVNLSTGFASTFVNGVTLSTSFTPVDGDSVIVDQITGGGANNQYQGQIYEIDLVDGAPIQGRWVTRGTEPVGQSTYIDLGVLDFRGVFEIEFDFIINDPSNPNEAVFGGSATVNDPDIYMGCDSTNGARIWHDGIDRLIIPASGVAQDRQYHIVVGYDGADAYAIVDGVEKYRVTTSAITTAPRDFWLIGASFQAFDHSNDIVTNFRYSGPSGNRFYPIDETIIRLIEDTPVGLGVWTEPSPKVYERIGVTGFGRMRLTNDGVRGCFVEIEINVEKLTGGSGTLRAYSRNEGGTGNLILHVFSIGFNKVTLGPLYPDGGGTYLWLDANADDWRVTDLKWEVCVVPEVIDTESSQNGTRVGMEADNFKYIPVNNHEWRFSDLTPESMNVGGDTILNPILGNIALEITNTRADGNKPA